MSHLWFQNYLNLNNAAKQMARAVNFQDKTLSYNELTNLSFATAQQLIDHYHIKPGQFVGLMMDPGLDLLPAIHGIWLAGAAFVTLDPKLPFERLRYMLEDAGIDVLITQPRYFIDISMLSRLLQRKINIFQAFTSVESAPVLTDETIVEFSEKLSYEELSPAYMIYTSGSTGLPKGVVCTHKGVANLCKAVQPILKLDATTRHLQFASISFDAAIWEIFPTLHAGGTVVLASREQLLPGKRLATFIQTQAITHLCLPPTILGKISAFADELTTLHTITMAGEACPPALAHRWLNNTRRVFNAYGATEITVCATIYEIQAQETKVPIGKALHGIQTYIIDPQGQSCEPNQPGELWVSGEGIALGYHHRPDLTAKCFVKAPDGNHFCYRTGDRVLQNEQGEIYFIGRMDQQVKVRGFRIELEAIEHVIYQFTGVAACAVKVFIQQLSDGTENKSIVAYLCMDQQQTLDEPQLRNFVAEKMPDYMLPHYYCVLPELPMMPNLSKVNRDVLPAPEELIANQQQNSASINNLDEKEHDRLASLCQFFDQALQQPKGTTQMDTDFFKAGGDSLGVACVLNCIEELFSVALPSHLFYENPTPCALLAICIAYAEGKGDILDPSAEAMITALLDQSNYLLPQTFQANLTPLSFASHNILLTGATGFLGSHLLYELLQKTTVKQVYCIIRATDDTHALLRLKQAMERYQLPKASLDKVVALAGNITQTNLGLSSRTYQYLTKQLDTIIHSAADISYIRPYSEAVKPNVEGTRMLLDLAATHKVKAFHHISSLSVYGATGTLLGLDAVDESYDIQTSLPILFFENGYTQAKWAAEHMVKKAQQQGLPVSIYRPGFIQGHTQTGAANTDDLFCRLIIGNIQLGMYPDFPHKYWLPVPVDYVSRAIAHIVLTKPLGTTYNLLPYQEPSHNELFDLIAGLGYPMRRVNSRHWLESLSQITAENALFPLMRFLTQKVYYNLRTILEAHHYTSTAHTDNTLNALKGTSIVCPNIDETLVNRYLSYFVEEKLLTPSLLDKQSYRKTLASIAETIENVSIPHSKLPLAVPV
jgi:amino acid adenylation domain-containing protein/thioester reductase-like protein